MSSEPEERFKCFTHEYLRDPCEAPLDETTASSVRSVLDEMEELQKQELEAPPPPAVISSAEDDSDYSDSSASQYSTDATDVAASTSGRQGFLLTGI